MLGNQWNGDNLLALLSNTNTWPIEITKQETPANKKRKLSRQSSTKSLSTLQPSSPLEDGKETTKRIFKFGAPEFERTGKGKTKRKVPDVVKKKKAPVLPAVETTFSAFHLPIVPLHTPISRVPTMTSSPLSVLDTLQALAAQTPQANVLPSFDEEAFPDDFEVEDYQLPEDCLLPGPNNDEDLDAVLDRLLPKDSDIPKMTIQQSSPQELDIDIPMDMPEALPILRRSLRISSRPNTRQNSPEKSPAKHTPAHLPPSFVLSSPIGTHKSSGKKAGLSPIFMGHVGHSPKLSPLGRTKSRQQPSPNPSPLKRKQRPKPKGLDITILSRDDAPSSAIDFEEAPQFPTIEEEEVEVQHLFNPPVVTLSMPLATMPGKHALPKVPLPQDKDSIISRVLKRKRDLQMDLTQSIPRPATNMQLPGKIKRK
jgi:hypothetical protein